jgi:Xaa-Pro dipeptidase
MNDTAIEKLHAWMREHSFPRFYLYDPANLAWLSDGGDFTVEIGCSVGWIEITEQELVVHTSKIEVDRLLEEEIEKARVISHPWYMNPEKQEPNDLFHDIKHLRLTLSCAEQERFRTLGTDAAAAVGNAVRAARPQWTEQDLAGSLAKEAYSRGIQPIVLLVAGEQRVREYRHPLPKTMRLGRLFMGVLCGKRGGLVANLTRMCSWGFPAASEMEDSILRIEAAALDATRPTATLGEVLVAARTAYRNAGHEDAFEEHHQGGITGYRSREILATPGSTLRLQAGMAVAWNPSIRGAKVEDTFLLSTESLENLTYDPDWPMTTVAGRRRPCFLRRRKIHRLGR